MSSIAFLSFSHNKFFVCCVYSIIQKPAAIRSSFILVRIYESRLIPAMMYQVILLWI